MSVTDISMDEATLNGTVDPNLQAATCFFEYGISTFLGNKMGTQQAGEGDEAVPVTQKLTGLSENTTYYYRLEATNASGNTKSQKGMFRTLDKKAPRVRYLPESGMTDVSTVLNGSVNPNGFSTTCRFDYGYGALIDGQIHYEFSTITQDIGSGEGYVSISAPIANLLPAEVYLVRIVATNERGTAYQNSYFITNHAEITISSDLVFEEVEYALSAPPSQQVTVTNSAPGQSTLNWNIEMITDGAVATTDLTSGAVPTGASDTLTFDVSYGLPIGTYTSTFRFNSNAFYPVGSPIVQAPILTIIKNVTGAPHYHGWMRWKIEQVRTYVFVSGSPADVPPSESWDNPGVNTAWTLDFFTNNPAYNPYWVGTVPGGYGTIYGGKVTADGSWAFLKDLSYSFPYWNGSGYVYTDKTYLFNIPIGVRDDGAPSAGPVTGLITGSIKYGSGYQTEYTMTITQRITCTPVTGYGL